MEKEKTSKKALRHVIEDSMQEALKSLELPEPGKKVRKVLHRDSKKLASIFADAIKRADKKADKKKKKAARFMESAVKGKAAKKNGVKKDKKKRQPAQEQPQQLEAV